MNGKIPSRNELLKVKGIGKETADSILLYAYNEPSFVIDAYTKRIAKNLGLADNMDYDYLKGLFEDNLPKDYKVFQEYHALLVEHAKRYYIKKNLENDFLLQ
jgi:endonuclease-3 related protein